eukprot:TRINITY_DN4356_c0_g1_i1.p1 TRINITY_DN4356_c0_g1~~TRINITY_DN4356_c0_g1_i1.p1  ORF type:complete len:135 (-),score=30.74 TRINITY_DN4356_c0_g1_i1:15-419(-)
MDERKGNNDDIQLFLEKVIERVQGLQAILVSDRDGVSLLTAQSGAGEELNAENTLCTVFATAADQASKCGLGKNKTLTTFFDNRLFVHINHTPLIITLLAEPDANCGVLLSLADELKGALEPLRTSIKSIEAEN